MSDRSVIEPEGFAELVCVVRPFAQSLDNSRSVDSASCSCDQVPQKLSECRAHRFRSSKDVT